MWSDATTIGLTAHREASSRTGNGIEKRFLRGVGDMDPPPAVSDDSSQYTTASAQESTDGNLTCASDRADYSALADSVFEAIAENGVENTTGDETVVLEDEDRAVLVIAGRVVPALCTDENSSVVIVDIRTE